MRNSEKVIKIFLTLVFVFGISYVPVLWSGGNSAQVISGAPTSFYGALNVNETVLKAQNKLKEIGLYSGRISGLFGFKTRQAILNYQISVNIPQTGILDALTQEKLFAPPQVEYILVNSTKYGNNFLSEWLEYTYGNTSEPVWAEGFLVSQEDTISVNDHLSTTRHLLISNEEEYLILNVSDKNLDEYLNLNVRINGYTFRDQTDSSKKILVTSYDTESSHQDDYPLAPYTKEGNDNLYDFVFRKINQVGEYVNISGKINVTSEYLPDSNTGLPTRVILDAIDGNKYAVENISGNDLENLSDQSVTVRGFILRTLNDSGYPTIVVNYFE